MESQRWARIVTTLQGFGEAVLGGYELWTTGWQEWILPNVVTMVRPRGATLNDNFVCANQWGHTYPPRHPFTPKSDQLQISPVASP